MKDWINRTARQTPTWVLYAAAVLLAVWTVYAAVQTPDPAKVLERELGLRGLQILIASLCITPLRWGGINLLKFRRAFGLMAFMFITLHFLTWSVLDLGLRWSVIMTDLTKRPYIIIGFAAFVALIPLALTSNLWSIKRLGPMRWKRLHWLVYPAVLAGAVHFILIGKVYTLESALYFATAAGLLIARRLKSRKALPQAT